MKSFDNYIYEEVTQRDLDNVEKMINSFAKVGLDIEFTRHFKDRVNDERNKKPITPGIDTTVQTDLQKIRKENFPYGIMAERSFMT